MNPVTLIAGRRRLHAADGRLAIGDQSLGGKWTMVRDEPLDQVRSIEIEETKAAQTVRGRGLVGMMVSRRTLPGQTGVLVTFSDGERVMLELKGSPLEVRGKLGPLLDELGDRA